MSASNIIADLPELEWRGLTAPCSVAPYTVTFDLAPRAYYGTDGYGHDNTGRQSTPFPVTLWFINTVRPNAFPELFNQWQDACINDKSPDWLLHPILGLTRARVQSFAVDHGANMRAGVKVDVVFVETLEDADTRVDFNGPDVAPEAAALAADTAMAAVGVSYPTNTTLAPLAPVTGQPSLDQATSFQEAYAAVKGQLFSASLTVTSALGSLLGTVGTVLDDIDALGSHDAWAARWNVLAFYGSLKRIQADVERVIARATATQVLQKDTTLDEFARTKANSLIDIMSLNVQALRSPVVLKGQTLRYYTGVKRLAA